MKKFKDIFGNEITDPFFLDIRQRLDELKKRNRGRKHFSEEDKEIDAISEELDKHWKILKEDIDKIPRSELVRRMRTDLDSRKQLNFGIRGRPGFFDTSLFDKNRLFDTSIFDKNTLYSNRVRRV